jgi:hypothetical protein
VATKTSNNDRRSGVTGSETPSQTSIYTGLWILYATSVYVGPAKTRLTSQNSVERVFLNDNRYLFYVPGFSFAGSY